MAGLAYLDGNTMVSFLEYDAYGGSQRFGLGIGGLLRWNQCVKKLVL
jgi:hypothetical protein